jgi:hypothetical protein
VGIPRWLLSFTGGYMKEIDMDSGEFRTTLQVSLSVDQFAEILNYLDRNKIKRKNLHSKWVPEGTPENEGYKEVI